MLAAVVAIDGSLLLVKSDIVRGRRITGFNLTDQYPDLAVQPEAEAAGATWVTAPVVVEGNLITCPHPDEAAAFTEAILSSLGVEGDVAGIAAPGQGRPR